ncbi:hypothetical protein LTR91_022891 [Friedmanniomyces endolithicus]|uniref:Citrate transporter-like domain-containing protein n=1 Tax=Friedmanniomyces endolithicus TaxID=329885 RepID=A0AAN6H7D6_9PEZI|nr:hypothetical protein LTR57_021485 [Friedmanniomyces endolithicus]KAK0955342.1 hypothetical protein LTR91_022891 [Friedmanniomyces endolithicus]KAK0970412.1 hypothetical protein LTS01_015788 [Friedmanniomyces endolithicus]
MADTVDELDTSVIKTWRSIVTLIVFVLTNIVVLFPFHIPLWVPRFCADAYSNALSALRIVPPPRSRESVHRRRFAVKPWKRLNFPMNFITAPLIADLFLLAISAIGRTEVHDGTVGSNNIFPIDIMVFFITLAYIAISIDASGLIRYLAFRVLQKGGNNGHRLYIYLYVFFFALTAFIGNDTVILSGTAFLAYMTRISRNIKDPKAWIFAQFSVANVGSAILVSSNPTNLVLTGAFNIKFIHYTANVIVPVLATVIVLGPFLLFIVFADNDLIPASIELHELDEAARNRAPVNPNIPHARGTADEIELADNSDEANNLSLEEIMNPFLDKGGAAFGAVIMAATLITILALNAATDTTKEHPVFWVTLPAAFVMFCWDVSFGWLNREKTREIARNGRREVEEARAKRAIEAEEKARLAVLKQGGAADVVSGVKSEVPSSNDYAPTPGLSGSPTSEKLAEKEPVVLRIDSAQARQDDRPTLASLFAESYQWCQETFPTVTAVLVHLPWALVPFALAMFVLVQALATKGWIPVFAHGWDHWVNKTGVVGAIGGMGFLSVIMCNFAGTNIGTTILLCRVVQVWIKLHERSGVPITQRTFWATVYSMAVGVNYGAFSTAFSASLAGLLWRDILTRKYIPVRSSTFAQVNLKIIAVAMAVGCAVLVGEMYITRSGTDAYQPG